MNKLSKNLSSFATSFASFLIHSLSEEDMLKINSIILFGSVARGDARKESDVDLFVDVKKDEKKLEHKIKLIEQDFYKSHVFKNYWNLLGIENDFKTIVGRLFEWKDLRSSIIANGIVLFGKYKETVKGKNYVMIYWDHVKPESKRTFLSKKLYGYNYKNKKYRGLLENIEGEKISHNCILIPSEHFRILSDLFNSMNITMKSVFVSKLE